MKIPNATRFRLASGSRWWFIVSCYLAPDDASTIHNIVASISQCPCGDVLLVAGAFNADLAAPDENFRREDIVAVIVTTGLEYMSAYFLPYRKSWEWYMGTWCMHLQGR